MPLNNNISI